MRPLFCASGETVMGEGNLGNEMFFLIKGKLEVLHQGNAVDYKIRVGEVREGGYRSGHGEYDLVITLRTTHTATYMTV